MTKERCKTQSKIGSPDQPIEDYLDRFARVGDQSSVLVTQSDNESVTSTLDGTRLYFSSQLAEKTGLNEKKIIKLLNSGKIKGVMLGDKWLASEVALREYQDKRARRK